MLSKNKRLPRLATEFECTGCMACVDICESGALRMYLGKDGHEYVCLNKEHCIGCLACERICQKSRNYAGENDLKKSRIYAAWSVDKISRKKATSGGVFAAIATQILISGGVVIGAAIIGRECKHIMISNINEIEMLQGSKYMWSSMDGIYKMIERELPNRVVLFSGLGCQCAGVLAYFSQNKYRENLYTMDLVCGGASSRILLDKFYKKYPEIDRIVSFRNKDKYELTVEKTGVKEIFSGKSLPLHGFNCALTNRYNCYNCQFARAHRKTDMTIGDLWNYNYMKEEHAKGISTLIIHNERGQKLVVNSGIVLNNINWSDCINYCKRIVWGKTHIFNARRNLIKNADEMSYQTFYKLYCIAMEPTDIPLEIFRIYRYILMRINDFKAKKYIRSLLIKNG